MAQLVAGFGSSHSIMLVSQRKDWQHGFREIDPKNPHLHERDGKKVSYAELLSKVPGDTGTRATPDTLGQQYDDVQRAMDSLRDRIAAAKLDSLIVIGDDQTELFRMTNMPPIAIYFGETIRNGKAELLPSDGWYKRARMARQEDGQDRDYPLDARLGEWLVRAFSDHGFDITAMNGLEPGQFEGHAFSFIHKRYLQGRHKGVDLSALPILPIILNTFDPPNQPTPARCVELGLALRELIAQYPSNQRIGVLASGGLSHFVVDEELDQGVLAAIRARDLDWLRNLSPAQLQAGSSEIRNWLVAIAALQDLTLDWVSYTPAYRSPALTGTGLCFAEWI